MRHFLVILLIVIVFTVFCIGFNGYTDRMIGQAMLALEQASTPRDFEELRKTWQKQAVPASLILDHDELEQFSLYVSEMEIEVASDPLALAVTKQKAKDLLRSIHQKAHFSWESVF